MQYRKNRFSKLCQNKGLVSGRLNFYLFFLQFFWNFALPTAKIETEIGHFPEAPA